MNISIIQPSRNNLVYLQWSYKSIRANQGNHTVQICVADDFSSDGTWEWCCNMKRIDPHFDAIRNDGPTRLGHTILYDRLVNEVAQHDICMIYHADMYLCPGALDAIESLLYGMEPTTEDTHKHLKIVERRKRIVSLTRIEPPLHPPGPEKILRDFGTEPDTFDETGLLNFHYGIWHPHGPGGTVSDTDNSVELPEFLETEGIFAPWAFWKSDFQEIGGHDPLFAPQSKEDSDIFNRFHLNGVEFIQTWAGFVYHMTCRGSRFNPTITTVGKNSSEWEEQNIRSARNFIRKWGHYVKHDPYMKPIVPHKYDIGIELYGGDDNVLSWLEPWCSVIYTTMPERYCHTYIVKEQLNTKYDMSTRVMCGLPESPIHDVTIRIRLDLNKFDGRDLQYIEMMSEILGDSGQPNSVMRVGNLEVITKELRPIESNLIHVDKK